ncbi:hypothetical protein M758_10G020500 [Ceratodon purpureus]|nr:hypothetical protein M758_10G020500 [Ceratodon purpureus]
MLPLICCSSPCDTEHRPMQCKKTRFRHPSRICTPFHLPAPKKKQCRMQPSQNKNRNPLKTWQYEPPSHRTISRKSRHIHSKKVKEVRLQELTVSAPSSSSWSSSSRRLSSTHTMTRSHAMSYSKLPQLGSSHSHSHVISPDTVGERANAGATRSS